MLSYLKSFVWEEEGATMVEYGLMVALIAIALVVAIGLVKVGLNTLFENVGTQVGS